jgi:MFS family permease
MKAPVFYGWYVLAASVVIELFGLGFGIFAITTVYPYIIDTFPDWSRREVFLPTSLISLLVGGLSPLVGWLIDRYPIRLVFIAGIVGAGAGAISLLARADPLQYLAASLLIGVGMSGVTILLTRCWCRAGSNPRRPRQRHRPRRHRPRRRHRPALITRIIEATDWRSAFVVVALLASVPPLLVVLTIVRGRPADVGLQPYGAADASTDSAPAATGMTLRAAMRHKVFWVFAAVIFLGGMPCYSHNKHILVFLKDLGFDPVTAADYKSGYFFISACGRLGFGWLADRVDKRNLLAVQVLLIAGGFPLLFLVPTQHGLLFPALLLVGAGYGGLLPSIPILTVHYFGRAHLGTLLGAYKIAYDLAAAGAPAFSAALYDSYGSYTIAQAWLTGFAWAAFLLALFGLPRQLTVHAATPLDGRARPVLPGARTERG